MSTSSNSNNSNSKSSESLRDAQKTSSPIIVESSSNQNSTNNSKKKGGKKIFLAFGCLSLLVCCFVCCVLFMVSPQIMLRFFNNSSAGSDSTLVRITSSEVPDLRDSVDTKNEVNSSDRVRQNVDGTYVVTFTEKEVLYIVADSVNLSNKPEALGIRIKNNFMKIEISAEELVANAEAEGEDVGVNIGFVKDMFLSMEMSVDRTNPSRIKIDKVSTGNTLLDRIIPTTFNAELEDSLNEGLNQGGASSELVSIAFKEGELEMVLRDKTGYDVPGQPLYPGV